ncbi:hypothetical protein SAMN05518668_109180 [Sphingobium sp. YR657]|uniref:ComEC/Rec2 family competence protein n=1 Tax=Sphingobium sp. YR657 TaxID=1884366 RepID=UPI00091326C6|nr:MBL fold metallo-hydrolase [Sphingobium sp. YR657]SHM44969.1 hypothetical protein SAMN05518668_109180 [Sphingobium sp. YR657]
MSGTLQVEMVGVGHGDCFVLRWQPKEGDPNVIVIDGGPRGGGRKLDATLKELGADKIDLMVLSHSDADHVDGLLEYAKLPKRAPIKRYWGPCLPAFQRHRWLFPPRITRGLDVAANLEAALRSDTHISWPVEHAAWQSEDGGLRIRVLSPAGRLIERLLIGDDALALFLEQPMPIGWLVSPPEEAGPEDRYADLRAAIASGEIDPAHVPDNLPGTSRVDPGAASAEAQRDYGIEPEFFGNSVLNDTSLILLVEADLGGAPKRLLFTGDLQTFTYLMANYPMGLGAEIVKAPHHGSRSHVGEKLDAYDEVWQWLRPRAVLVSAGGKHGLPRHDFRNAALRTGASLFCACQRQKELLAGPPRENSCHAEFACTKGERSIRLDIARDRIEANAQACGAQGTAHASPVIQMVQHLVDPSAILDRLTTAERDRSVKWLHDVLKDAHADRMAAGGEAGLKPVSQIQIAEMATARGFFRASASMEIIVDAAVRAGKIWASNTDRFHREERCAWVMPSEVHWRKLFAWLLNHAVILLSIEKRQVGLVPRELLLAADTKYLAQRVAELFAFPEDMFAPIIWPRLVERLIEKKWQVFHAEFDGDNFTSILCAPVGIEETFQKLVASFDRGDAGAYLGTISCSSHSISAPIPASMVGLIVPSWSPIRRAPTGREWILRSTSSEEHRQVFCNPGLVTDEERWLLYNGYRGNEEPEAAVRLLAAYFVGGYERCK